MRMWPFRRTHLTPCDLQLFAALLQQSGELKIQAERIFHGAAVPKTKIQGANKMSPVQTFAAQEAANLAATATALTGITTGIAALDADIQQLQAQIAASSSTLTPADQAALDTIVASSGALVTQAQGISTSIPAPAPPAPTAATAHTA